MIDTRLRARVQPVFNKIGDWLIHIRLTPDTITVIALVVGLSGAVMVGLGQMALALVLLWLSGLFDVLDGTVARLTNRSSQLGAYMDLIFDRLVEGAMILGFYFYQPDYALSYLVFFVAVLFNFTTFMVAGALFKNEGEKSMHYDVGIAERTETFIVFSLMMLLPKSIVIILMAFNAIIFLTGILRFYKIWRFEKKLDI